MTKTANGSDDFNVFAAGKTGAFKGIKIDDNAVIVKNLQNVETLKPENEISILNWSENSETTILIGTINQFVKIYDANFKAYSTSFEAKYGSGPLVGLTRIDGAVATCSRSGHVKVWKYKKNEELELPTGGDVSKMKKYHQKDGIVGLGGKQNDLKIWDLERKTKIFCAKNVKKTMLELEVPIWVTDLTFLQDSEYKIAVSTRYGQIRLYDTKAQRRPVIDINVEDQSFNTISLCYDNNQVIVGSATGHLMAVDFRGKGKILHRYKGPIGSVRQVAAHQSLPYFASVGLDRYLRIYHIEDRKMLHEQYLKVRLNCVLLGSNFGKNSKNVSSVAEVAEKEEEVECIDLESDNEFNEIFENMECVGGKPKRKKRKLKE